MFGVRGFNLISYSLSLSLFLEDCSVVSRLINIPASIPARSSCIRMWCRRPVFVFGLAVLSMVEWLLRCINVYEPVKGRRCSVFSLVPRALRALALSIASFSFSYFLAQFLALLSVFLTSAFIQLTLKVCAGLRASVRPLRFAVPGTPLPAVSVPLHPACRQRSTTLLVLTCAHYIYLRILRLRPTMRTVLCIPTFVCVWTACG